jgi:hypothetical protein
MIVPTFTATIFVGQKDGRSDNYKHRAVAEKVIQEYCDDVGLCVHVYDTRYIYSGGWEDGFAVGLINYPRFPAEPETIKTKALELAEKLLAVMEQFLVTVVMPNETVMIGPKL